MRLSNSVAVCFAAVCFHLTFSTAQPELAQNIGHFLETDTIDQGIPLRRIPRQRLFHRDLLNARLAPNNKVDFDSLHRDGSISTYSLSHGNATYVNLEDLQVHGLIHHTPVCSEPDANNITILTIGFESYDSFRVAKQHWSNEDSLLFVVEDASCAAEAGDRSVYHAISMDFLEGPGSPLAIRVSARHENVAWYDSNAASEISFSVESVASFRKRHAHSFFPAKRREREKVSPDLPISIPGLPTDLPDPRTILTPIVSKLTSKAGEVLDKIFEEVSDLLEGEFDASFGIHVHKNLEGKQRVQPLGDLQDLGFLPTFTFIDSVVDMDFEVYFAFTFKVLDRESFDALKGDDINSKFAHSVGNGMNAVKIGVRAKKDVKVSMQVELYIPGGVEFFCAFSLTPPQMPLGCSLAATIGTIPTNKDSPPIEKIMRKPPKEQKEEGGGLRRWAKFGLEEELLAGIHLWTRIGAHADVNFTTPGFDVVIPAGSAAELGWRNGEMYREEMQAQVHWRAPEIHIENGRVYASISIGPRVTLSFKFPGLGKVPDLIDQKLSFSARFDLPRVEISAGQAKGVDEQCQPATPGMDAIGLWVDILIKFYASMVLPFVGVIFDTDWVGNVLDRNYQGHLWKKTLWGICKPENQTAWPGVEDKLNNKFKEIAADLNHETLEEYDEFIPAWKDNNVKPNASALKAHLSPISPIAVDFLGE